ncbi:peptidylprolyl isomerase [Pseudonocardia benzenivorans]
MLAAQAVEPLLRLVVEQGRDDQGVTHAAHGNASVRRRPDLGLASTRVDHGDAGAACRHVHRDGSRSGWSRSARRAAPPRARAPSPRRTTAASRSTRRPPRPTCPAASRPRPRAAAGEREPDRAVHDEPGDLRFDLDRSIAPCNVQNFVDLAGADFFDGTTCHRLSTTAGLPIIQCGDPTGTGAGGPGFTVKDEFPRDYPPATGYAVTYPRGVIAMAGSTMPNSAGSQFFVTYGDAAITPRFSVIGRASNETSPSSRRSPRAGTTTASRPATAARTSR